MFSFSAVTVVTLQGPHGDFHRKTTGEMEGNDIRELENAIERLVVLTPGMEVGLKDLPTCLQTEAATPLERIGLVLPSKGISLREIEKEVFREALRKNDWNRTRAARYLGVTRDTLNYRLRKYGLDRVKALRRALDHVEQTSVTALVN